MKTLKEHESPHRQWFALTAEGMVCLGDCGDFEAADEIATDLGYETNWLISPDDAQVMSNIFASKGITPEGE